MRRLAELQRRHEELVRFNDAMLGCEMRGIKLSQKINALCRSLGESPCYDPAAGESAPISPSPLS